MNTGNLATGNRKQSHVAAGTFFENEVFNESAGLVRPGSDGLADSHDALLLNEALHTAQNAPDIRQEKVAALKAEIQSGQYEIDLDRLALSLLRDEAQLFRF